MKVIAFNSSPHRDRGGTGLILNPFLDGARQAGAEVELFYVQSMDIRPCLGCYVCWTSTPGQCAQEDDMNAILPRIAEADIVVYATPLYVDGMNGPMKALLDRTIPLIEPRMEIRNDHCRHPRRASARPGKVVLVSVCGFTEPDNFDALVLHIRAVCRNLDRQFAGALLRPYASSLPALAKRGVAVEDVLAAAREGGRQIVETGTMTDGVRQRVSRELIPRDTYIRAVNARFRRLQSKKETR